MRTMANSNFRLRSITIRVKFSDSHIHSVYCAIYAVYIYAVVILMSVFAFEPITEGTYKRNVYLNNFRHVSGHAHR